MQVTISIISALIAMLTNLLAEQIQIDSRGPFTLYIQSLSSNKEVKVSNRALAEAKEIIDAIPQAKLEEISSAISKQGGAIVEIQKNRKNITVNVLDKAHRHKLPGKKSSGSLRQSLVEQIANQIQEDGKGEQTFTISKPTDSASPHFYKKTIDSTSPKLVEKAEAIVNGMSQEELDKIRNSIQAGDKVTIVLGSNDKVEAINIKRGLIVPSPRPPVTKERMMPDSSTLSKAGAQKKFGVEYREPEDYQRPLRKK